MNQRGAATPKASMKALFLSRADGFPSRSLQGPASRAGDFYPRPDAGRGGGDAATGRRYRSEAVTYGPGGCFRGGMIPCGILVFDDDPALGRFVVKLATLKGMQATAVESAEAFRELVHSEHPDIIMLALQLGPTDGVEQLRLLAEWHYAGTLILHQRPRWAAAVHRAGPRARPWAEDR